MLVMDEGTVVNDWKDAGDERKEDAGDEMLLEW